MNKSPFFTELGEVLEEYQRLLVSPVHLEKGLLDAFPSKEFQGFEKYYPRMYRGLPRVYNINNPSDSRIKKHFTNLDALKAGMIGKSLFSLYAPYEGKGDVVVLSYVMDDGLGDYMAAAKAAKILGAHLIALVEKKAQEKWKLEGEIIVYEEGRLAALPLKRLQQADVVLQIPTLCPYPLPEVNVVNIGEYGFAESSWFHPKSGNYSMGLHVLEKGIFTGEKRGASWEEVENGELKAWHKRENRFYLAYLSSEIGGIIYLTALVKSLEKEEGDVDLCVPDLAWFIRFIEQKEWNLNVKAIEVRFQERIYVKPLKETGKILRILSPKALSQSDFERLLALSGDFVAVRGNQSFSEAINAEIPFFYDARAHSRYFFKDLVAIAENRLKGYPGTQECVRAMYRAFLHQLPAETGTFVEETYFQPLEDPTLLAETIGLALQDPKTKAGFAKLAQIIKKEGSINDFLIHLVNRSLLFRKRPQVQELETLEMQNFLSLSQSCSATLSNLKKKLRL